MTAIKVHHTCIRQKRKTLLGRTSKFCLINPEMRQEMRRNRNDVAVPYCYGVTFFSFDWHNHQRNLNDGMRIEQVPQTSYHRCLYVSLVTKQQMHLPQTVVKFLFLLHSIDFINDMYKNRRRKQNHKTKRKTDAEIISINMGTVTIFGCMFSF